MKHYDYTYLTRQDMADEAAQQLQNKLAEMITTKNGVIVDLPKSYKKRLAYRIKKQEIAYVNAILFQAEPHFAVDFKKQTDVMAEILRGLIVSYDPEKLKKEIRRERPIAEKNKEAEIIIPSAVEKSPEPEKTTAVKEKPAKPETTTKEKDTEEKPKEEKPTKPKRRTKIKAELRDIEEKLDEILK